MLVSYIVAVSLLCSLISVVLSVLTFAFVIRRSTDDLKVCKCEEKSDRFRNLIPPAQDVDSLKHLKSGVTGHAGPKGMPINPHGQPGYDGSSHSELNNR